MAKEISIQEVMAIISEPEAMGETFTLRFVRGSGKNKGSIATVAKCRYGAPRRHREEPTSTPKSSTGATPGGSWGLHKEHGTLPMYDTEKRADQAYFTPFISHIIGYKDYKVIH